MSSPVSQSAGPVPCAESYQCFCGDPGYSAGPGRLSCIRGTGVYPLPQLPDCPNPCINDVCNSRANSNNICIPGMGGAQGVRGRTRLGRRLLQVEGGSLISTRQVGSSSLYSPGARANCPPASYTCQCGVGSAVVVNPVTGTQTCRANVTDTHSVHEDPDSPDDPFGVCPASDPCQHGKDPLNFCVPQSETEYMCLCGGVGYQAPIYARRCVFTGV